MNIPFRQILKLDVHGLCAGKYDTVGHIRRLLKKREHLYGQDLRHFYQSRQRGIDQITFHLG